MITVCFAYAKAVFILVKLASKNKVNGYIEKVTVGVTDGASGISSL